jgi:hypothetical protein
MLPFEDGEKGRKVAGTEPMPAIDALYCNHMLFGNALGAVHTRATGMRSRRIEIRLIAVT